MVCVPRGLDSRVVLISLLVLIAIDSLRTLGTVLVASDHFLLPPCRWRTRRSDIFLLRLPLLCALLVLDLMIELRMLLLPALKSLAYNLFLFYNFLVPVRQTPQTERECKW